MQTEFGFLFYIPLWGMLLILGLLFPLSAILGSLLGKWSARKFSAKEAPSNFVPSTILGLLALLLGFTFSMAVSRYDARKKLILQESNDIGTAYLRASTVTEPFRTKIRGRIKEYAQARIDFFDAGTDLDLVHQAQSNGVRLQKQLWKDIEELTKNDRSAIAGHLMSSVNAMIDTSSEQEYVILNRVPELVYILILIVTMIGIGSLGYIDNLHNEKSKFGIITLSILFAVVVVLIQDLDRPRRGLIQMSQKGLQNILDSM